MLFKPNGIFEVPSIPALPGTINVQPREKMEALTHHPMETYLKERGNNPIVLRYGPNKYSIILINRSIVIAISKCKLRLSSTVKPDKCPNRKPRQKVILDANFTRT